MKSSLHIWNHSTIIIKPDERAIADHININNFLKITIHIFSLECFEKFLTWKWNGEMWDFNKHSWQWNVYRNSFKLLYKHRMSSFHIYINFSETMSLRKKIKNLKQKKFKFLLHSVCEVMTSFSTIIRIRLQFHVKQLYLWKIL